MSDRYEQTHEPDQRVQVTVLFLEGTGAGTRARLETEAGEKLWVAATLVAEGLGVPVDEYLPLKRAVALVRDGELVSFEPVER